jgi:uncharacterized protein (TIGR02217 family)
MVNLVQFPLEVSKFGASVRYLTDITIGRNGQEVRNALWQDPLKSFNAAFGVKTFEDIVKLDSFFHLMKGREQSFLVKDYSDYKVDTWTAFEETPNGVKTTFQLVKKYSVSGVGDYYRPITKPKAGSVTARIDGAITPVTYSLSTGVVTFTVAPGVGTVVDFKISEFYVPVRFDIDELPIEMLSWWVDLTGADFTNANVPDIPLKEVRGE